tara:strand:- start:1086 stop:1550 length:465 start_codon:yes stop_codon:yes gene_type:complete
MEELMFDGDRLRYKSLKDYVAFKAFYDFASDKDALDAHIHSHEYYALDSSLHEEGTEIRLRENKSEEVGFSLTHFGGLTVVSLCTTFEVAVKEFLCCYFFYNPNSMYEFIGRDESRGLVPLKDVLLEDTYQGLILSLAKKASSKASKGKTVMFS